MGKQKYDGVVEAVRYTQHGQIMWVRAYERRGSSWSDHVLLSREKLVERLKAGKVFLAGSRVEKMGGTFEVSLPLRLQKTGQQEIIITNNGQTERDLLTGVPLV